MSGTEYPKIETLFNRNKETFKVETHLGYRLPEFGLIKSWWLTEKIDGTNIRIEYLPEGLPADQYSASQPSSDVYIKGRTDNADIPPILGEVLYEMFPVEKLKEVFDQDARVVLYGEGYGARIQKGGGDYREGVSFRLFDVKVGDWWLNWENVVGVAESLGIKTVPSLSVPATTGEALYVLRVQFIESTVALEDGGNGRMPEGIVARTNPLLFTRKGERLMWKLKHKDLA